MIIYTTAQTVPDLEGILALQKTNLPAALSGAEMTSQGFVTVVHSLVGLQQMNNIEQHIIAKHNDKVIAYLLAMTPASKNDLPILEPMFALFESIYFKGKPVAAYRYLLVGQVCVDKAFRGQGILDECYQLYRKQYRPKYEFAITEIATRNTRSLQAHRRIGFTGLHRYMDPGGEEWSIVIWDWA